MRPSLFPIIAGGLVCAGLTLLSRTARQGPESTRVELTGAVWSTVLSRYIVAVDQGGPYPSSALLALTEAGQLDDAPIAVEGSFDSNDLGAIAAGPDGTLFVSAAPVRASRGAPRRRSRIVQLAVQPDRQARAVGKLDLTAARFADGTSPWVTDAAPDVVGLTFHDDALYLGVSAPLGADGSTAILKLEHALTALGSGLVPVGALSVWSRARLCTARNGKNVCEGVADLAFLGDGSVLVTANSAQGADGGGALWKFLGPSSPPELLKRFDGLKPEGLAVSPDRSSAIVVFDTEGREPLWISWPISA